MDAKLVKKGASQENKIKLTLLNNTGYVFEVKDYMTLRKHHHIVGALVGTCSNRGWSANDCTMPVELSPLETRLLLEQGIAELVSKKESLLRQLSNEELLEHAKEFDLRINQQKDTLNEEKLKESERNMEKIMAGKRKKLLKQGVQEKDIHLNPSEILQEIRAGLKFDSKNALLDIPCAHAEEHEAQLVHYLKPDHSLKYLVFRDYWLKGKYITCGDAFGADFLVYPGDPLLYHASHIVILLKSSKINPLDLVTKVRLSVTVNKLCVFAYLDEESKDANGKPKIVYQTFVWEGNRDKER
ncbi:tRNA-splicing endonuclease subunit Sen34 [Lucilia cuprina]|uniref:tRNA-splicing endonuclease subunit Sen34 n=1 Tax=Lucilia cuprina TaxID=7375 RepID=UPI001F0521A0|nr:tRNA-splicing endonuclease subunit Sen34 [Lucilia cuprina]